MGHSVAISEDVYEGIFMARVDAYDVMSSKIKQNKFWKKIQ